jgi:hypothetical protein
VYFDFHEQERTTMQSRIRIIKRGAGGNTNGVSADEIEKTVQQREREMTNAVKSWVAEWESRNRALKTAAASLIRSLENSRPGPVTQFV